MKGTEKQIKWAEEIKAYYVKCMDEAAEYLEKVIETGSTRTPEYPAPAMAIVDVYHYEALYNTVDHEMRSSELFKAYRSAERGTQERKEANKKYNIAVAGEALARLRKAVAERTAIEDARYWIEHRMH